MVHRFRQRMEPYANITRFGGRALFKEFVDSAGNQRSCSCPPRRTVARARGDGGRGWGAVEGPAEVAEEGAGWPVIITADHSFFVFRVRFGDLGYEERGHQ